MSNSKQKQKLPAGCALCNRIYEKNHICEASPYSLTELRHLAAARQKKLARKKK